MRYWLSVLTLCGLLAAPAQALPDHELSGVIFGQAGLSPSPALSAMPPTLTRAYLNVLSRHADYLHTRLTIDAGKGQLDKSFVLLKYAYMDWSQLPFGIGLRIGRQGVPWVAYEEDLWGYRVQGPVYAEREKLLPGAEWGLAALGSSPIGDYHLGVYQGDGRVAEAPSLHGRWTVTLGQGLQLSALCSFGEGAYNTLGLMTAYRLGTLALGGSVVHAPVRTGGAGAGLGMTGFGHLGLGCVHPWLAPLELMGRLDRFRADPGTSHVRTVVGCAIKPLPGVTLVLSEERFLSDTSSSDTFLSNLQLTF